MKMRDNGIYHNLRLSPNNPDHMKINDVLLDVNKQVYKSKNQFMTEALLYYISGLEGNPLTNREQQKFNQQELFITRKEMESLILDLKQELTQYVDREVLSVIIKVFSENLKTEKPVQVVREEMQDDAQDDSQVDEKLIALASSWS